MRRNGGKNFKDDGGAQPNPDTLPPKPPEPPKDCN